MTYPPQQPENGWSDNQQQQPQQPVDPFAQAAPGHQAQPVDPFGQPPQQYGNQQAYPQQPQQEYGQSQYNHDEIPTDQTPVYTESPQHNHSEEHTQVIRSDQMAQGHQHPYSQVAHGQDPYAQPQGQELPQQQGHAGYGQPPQDQVAGQPQGYEAYGQQPQAHDPYGQAPQGHDPYAQAPQHDPDPYGQAPQHDPYAQAQVPQGHTNDPEHTQVLAQHQYAQQPQQHDEHTQVLGQRRQQPPIEESTQVIAQASPIPPQYPQAPVSASPAFGQPYGAQVSASPASGQPFGAPVSASPASGQPFGAPVSASPASGQPFGAPVSASPMSGQFSPYAEAPPGVPASPFTPAPAIQPMSAAPASSQPWTPSNPTPQFTPKKRRGLPSWLYVVGVVVIVAALAVSAIFYFGVGEGSPEADVSPSPSKQEEVLALLTEQTSGLGYIPMGDPWGAISQSPELGKMAGFESTTGQYVVADTDWAAIFLVGAIDTEAVDYESNAIRGAVEQLAVLSEEQARSIIADGTMADRISGYGRDVEPVYTQLRVDGRSAGFITYHISWEDSKSNETGSTVTVGIIDLGDGKLAGFLIDIPDTLAPALTDSAMQAMNTLQFS